MIDEDWTYRSKDQIIMAIDGGCELGGPSIFFSLEVSFSIATHFGKS